MFHSFASAFKKACMSNDFIHTLESCTHLSDDNKQHHRKACALSSNVRISTMDSRVRAILYGLTLNLLRNQLEET